MSSPRVWERRLPTTPRANRRVVASNATAITRNEAAMTVKEITAKVVENRQTKNNRMQGLQTKAVNPKRRHLLQRHRKAHPSNKAKGLNAAVHTIVTEGATMPKVAKVQHR